MSKIPVPCSVCGSSPAVKSRTQCAGHGDYYNVWSIKFPVCGFSFSSDDYYFRGSDLHDKLYEIWNDFQLKLKKKG